MLENVRTNPLSKIGSEFLALLHRALLPRWMPWIRKRYRMTPPIEKQLLGMVI